MLIGFLKEEPAKNKKAEEEEEEEEEDESMDDAEENSDSDGSEQDGDEEEGEEEEEEDIPLSDLSEDEREDVIPHQRLTINNSSALTASTKRISFVSHLTPFSEHNSIVSKENNEVSDANDDLNRELAFYKTAQSAALLARKLLKKEGISFTRPRDYFAEMVKTDEHMGKIKKKLYDEAAGKKASADARKQRDLKKFGKQVQVAKLQQRAKEKKEAIEKVNSLKKSMYFLSHFIDPDVHLLTTSPQSGRQTHQVLAAREMSSLTSPLKTQSRRTPVSVGATRPADPRRSAKRRTRNSASVVKSDMPRAVMRCLAEICVAIQLRR